MPASTSACSRSRVRGRLAAESQCTQGFAMQSLLIGLSTVIASALPFLLTNVFHMAQTRVAGTIPSRALFFLHRRRGFFVRRIVDRFTTKEYPPENMRSSQAKSRAAGIAAGAREILVSIARCRTMRQLAGCKSPRGWAVLHVALLSRCRAAQCLRAPDTNSLLYSAEPNGGVCFGMYSLVCFAFSFACPRLPQTWPQVNT